MVVAIGATTAYFSNTEKSSGNTFIAGAIDLKVDNECHYNEMVCKDGTWQGPTGGYPVAGTSCDCTWELSDLDGKAIFNFTDIKPGDEGEDTISLHVDTNPAWICAEISNVQTAENGCNPPEKKAEPNCEQNTNGELQDNLLFSVWMDPNCNNIYDNDETYIIQDAKVTDAKWPIADSQHGRTPITDTCIGVAWNVPDAVGNVIQGDSITGDITFKAYQARNNAAFTCYQQDGCFDQADVMLVLDRSGSIDGGELTSLKNAANAFIDALSPDGGVHMGQTSFSTNGSLDQTLTGDQTALYNAVNALTNSGYTNLYEGILLADQELVSVRDRDDTQTPDYIVVITDGRPNRPIPEAYARSQAATAATAAKTAGVTIYVVGVGSDVDSTYLRNQIATSPVHYFGIGDYDDLEAILLAIAECQTPELPPVPITLFSDAFSSTNPLSDGWTGVYAESGDNESLPNDIYTRNDSNSYDGYYMVTEDDAAAIRSINTAGYKDIVLSYYRRTSSTGTGDLKKVEWRVGNAGAWTTVESTDPSSTWAQNTFNFPSTADNQSEIQIRFWLDDGEGDYGFWDNVLVQGTPQ